MTGTDQRQIIGYHTIQEIAELLQQGLVKCEEFKEFTSHICCEEHPVVVIRRLLYKEFFDETCSCCIFEP